MMTHVSYKKYDLMSFLFSEEMDFRLFLKSFYNHYTNDLVIDITDLDKIKFQHTIVNYFLPIIFNICFGCS